MDLVIGSAGCLGAAVSAALLRSGRPVRALDLIPSRLDGVDERVGDMGDEAALSRALEGVTTVHQCASVLSLNSARRAEMWETNVDRNRRVMARCRAAGVRAFVYASNHLLTLDRGEHARGLDERAPYATRPLSAYVASRIASEQDVLAADDPGAGFRTISLRTPTLYGPRDRFHFNLQLTLADTGRGTRIEGQRHCSHTYAENAAHAHVLAGDALRAGEHGGKAYHLSDEAPPPSYWELMDRLLVACGRRPPRATLSRSVLAAMTHASEALYARVGAYLEQEPFFSYEGLAVVASDCWFRTDAIRRDLGWAPPVPPDEAARRTAAWFTTHPIPTPLVAWKGLLRRRNADHGAARRAPDHAAL